MLCIFSEQTLTDIAFGKATHPEQKQSRNNVRDIAYQIAKAEKRECLLFNVKPLSTHYRICSVMEVQGFKKSLRFFFYFDILQKDKR